MKKLGGRTEHHPAFQDVPAFALVLVLTGTRFTSPLDWAFIALAEGF